VVCLCHLALEKVLKAHVTEVRQTSPVITHDLIYLVKKSGPEMVQAHLEFIGKINTASIPTRYPEDLERPVRDYPKLVAKEYLRQTQEIIQLLKQHPNLTQ
jgi:HEPN domain-containing protein